MNKISNEIATQEVTDWMDYKKVNNSKRETYKANIAALVEAIEEGSLVINDDKTMTYTLKFSYGNEEKVESLKFKVRLMIKEINSAMKGVGAGDFDGMVLARASALTNKSKEILRNMDTEDYSIVQSIAIFFL